MVEMMGHPTSQNGVGTIPHSLWSAGLPLHRFDGLDHFDPVDRLTGPFASYRCAESGDVRGVGLDCRG